MRGVLGVWTVKRLLSEGQRDTRIDNLERTKTFIRLSQKNKKKASIPTQKKQLPSQRDRKREKEGIEHTPTKKCY